MGRGFKDDEAFDSFWDISALMPAKKEKPPQAKEKQPPSTGMGQKGPPASPSGETVGASAPSDGKLRFAEVGDDAPVTSATPARTGLWHPSLSRAGEEEFLCYQPQRNALLTYVKLYKRPNEYSFYRNFRTLAAQWHGWHGTPCDPVPFFSYVPQYAQLTHAQRNFYLYWRDRAREGEYLPCDISYLWLYIYEIINLPDLIPPEEGVGMLARLWCAYRQTYPKMDKYMTVWLADYCLIHQQPCPDEILSGFLPAILENAGFREFYLGYISSPDEYGANAVLSLASSYHWQNSRFMKTLPPQEQQHLLRALAPVVKDVCEDKMIVCDTDKVSLLSRDAFSGSLCAHNVKCRVEVGYHSFSQTPRLTEVLTAAVKYAENQLRAVMGQKSRLSVGGELTETHKTLIDAYFAPLFSHAKPPEKKTEVVPEYEKLYDAIPQTVSIENAEEIEASSWDNTRLLVPEEEEIKETVTADLSMGNASVTLASSDITEIFDENSKAENATVPPKAEKDAEIVAFLSQLLAEGHAACTFETVALCERINELFSDLIGDVAVEVEEDECYLIEDYREEIEQWLKQ